MLRTEPRNKNDDQAPTAILELVDGPRDMRFAMTARTVARERAVGEGEIREVTLRNVAKVTRYREGGEEALQRAVAAVETARGLGGREEGENEGEYDGGDGGLRTGGKKERWRNLPGGRPEGK